MWVHPTGSETFEILAYPVAIAVLVVDSIEKLSACIAM